MFPGSLRKPLASELEPDSTLNPKSEHWNNQNVLNSHKDRHTNTHYLIHMMKSAKEIRIFPSTNLFPQQKGKINLQNKQKPDCSKTVFHLLPTQATKLESLCM